MPCELHAGFYYALQVWSKTVGCSVKIKVKLSNGLLDMAINVGKSACMRIGVRHNVKCMNISTADGR